MTINLHTALATDYDRASLMWAYAGDAHALMGDLMLAISEQASEEGTLPESICAKASAVLGAAMLYDVWQRLQGDDSAATEYDYSEAVAACQTLEHAGYDHGDGLALAIIGKGFVEAIEAIEEWVLANLAETFAEVIDLVEHAAEFADWETALLGGPDDTNDAA